jgi:hypothetical protein
MAGAILVTMTAGPVLAAPTCADATDREVFDVTGLKSRLMVLATGCGASSEYNSFMTRFKSQLVEYDRELQAYFKRHFGHSGQKEYDSYITALANSESTVGIGEGSDFCPHDAMIFTEVMALPATADLPAYAAGKDVIPASVGACVEPEPPAPSHGHARKAKK